MFEPEPIFEIEKNKISHYPSSVTPTSTYENSKFHFTRKQSLAHIRLCGSDNISSLFGTFERIENLKKIQMNRNRMYTKNYMVVKSR